MSAWITALRIYNAIINSDPVESVLDELREAGVSGGPAHGIQPAPRNKQYVIPARGTAEHMQVAWVREQLVTNPPMLDSAVELLELIDGNRELERALG